MTPDCDMALRAVNYYVARAWRAASEADGDNKVNYVKKARDELEKCSKESSFDIEAEARHIDRLLNISNRLMIQNSVSFTTGIVEYLENDIKDLKMLINDNEELDYRSVAIKSLNSKWINVKGQKKQDCNSRFQEKIEEFSTLVQSRSYFDAKNFLDQTRTFCTEYNWAINPEWTTNLETCHKLLHMYENLESGVIENLHDDIKEIQDCGNTHLKELIDSLICRIDSVGVLKRMFNDLLQIMSVDPHEQTSEELRRGEKIVKRINKHIRKNQTIYSGGGDIVANWSIYEDSVHIFHRYEYFRNKGLEVWQLSYLFLDKYRSFWEEMQVYAKKYPNLFEYRQIELESHNRYKLAKLNACEALVSIERGNIDILRDLYRNLLDHGYKMVPWLEKTSLEETNLTEENTPYSITVGYIDPNDALRRLETIREDFIKQNMISVMNKAKSFLDVNPDHSRVILENELEHVMLSDKLLAGIQLFREQELDPALRKYEKVKEFVEGAKSYRKQRQYEDAWRLLIEAEKVLPKADILCSARDELIPYLRVHLGSLLRAVEMAWWEKKIDVTEATAKMEFLLQLPRVAEFFNDESKGAKQILAELDSGTNLLVANRVKA